MSNNAPTDSQLSSSIGIFFTTNFFNLLISAENPNICTGITALFFLFIFDFKSFGHMFKVSSIFVIIGVAPKSKIASTVAIKLKACVITSSPLLTPRALRPIFIAAVPEETHCTYFDLK